MMNWKTGLLRLWFVITAFWFLTISFIAYDPVITSIKESRLMSRIMEPMNSILLVPVTCDKARGDVNKDYITQENFGFNQKEKYLCFYELPNFRNLFPEYNDLSDSILSDKLYSTAGIAIKKIKPALVAIFEYLALAFIPPAALFGGGISIFWVFAGFRNKQTETESKNDVHKSSHK